MKLIITILLFLISLGNGKINLINESLTNPDLNILYRGNENIIRITGFTEIENLTLNSRKCKILKGKDFFNVLPYEIGVDTLYLLENQKIIFTKAYVIKKTTFPRVYLGRIRDTIVSKSDVLNQTQLEVEIPDCFIKDPIRIMEFYSTLIKANGDTLLESYHSEGNIIDKSLNNYIHKLDKGGKLNFSVVCIGKNSTARAIPLNLTVN